MLCAIAVVVSVVDGMFPTELFCVVVVVVSVVDGNDDDDNRTTMTRKTEDR